MFDVFTKFGTIALTDADTSAEAEYIIDLRDNCREEALQWWRIAVIPDAAVSAVTFIVYGTDDDPEDSSAAWTSTATFYLSGLEAYETYKVPFALSHYRYVKISASSETTGVNLTCGLEYGA